ncbi:MAG TPA: hypothetical protein VG013_33015 [Gemmataceae bacterium]|nr:hypothetical protein [Gemmataceae bacterium]
MIGQLRRQTDGRTSGRGRTFERAGSGSLAGARRWLRQGRAAGLGGPDFALEGIAG